MPKTWVLGQCVVRTLHPALSPSPDSQSRPCIVGRYSVGDQLPKESLVSWFRYRQGMREWGFLTNHARAVLLIAGQPDVRLREIAVVLGVTERTAFRIVDDLAVAGYLVKKREGRRNCYHVESHLPLRDDSGRNATLGKLLNLLVERTSTLENWAQDSDEL